MHRGRAPPALVNGSVRDGRRSLGPGVRAPRRRKRRAAVLPNWIRASLRDPNETVGTSLIAGPAGIKRLGHRSRGPRPPVVPPPTAPRWVAAVAPVGRTVRGPVARPARGLRERDAEADSRTSSDNDSVGSPG